MNFIRFSIISMIIIYWCSLGGGTSLNRTIRQTSCSAEQFHCKGGGCISSSDVCNGLSHCNDNSDEDPSVCNCGTGAAVGNLRVKPPGAHEAPSGAQPWLVAIYKVRHNKHHSLICYGTLIYENIVLTSANCVIDPDTRVTYLYNLLRISVGKLKRDYNIDESIQQKVEVNKIVIMDRYDGDTKGYAKNLAVIKLKNPIIKSEYLRPACLWTHKTFPSGARRGIIAGWSLETSDFSGFNLMESLVNMMDIDDCFHKFYDPLFKSYLTNDKFCMTFDQGVSIEGNEVGGPVTFQHEGRFYLVGVISVQQPGSTFGIATKISKHLDWIKKTVYDLKEEDSCFQGNRFNCMSNLKCIKKELVCDRKKDCDDGSDEDPSLCTVKPATNENGASCEIPEGSEIFKAVKCLNDDFSRCKSKFYAPTNSRYQITCPNGRGFAKPGAMNMTAVCHDGEWIPDLKDSKCLKLCSPQEYKSLAIQCQYQGSRVDCNEMMRPETIIKVNCKKQFKKQVLVNYAEKTKCRKDGTLQHDISAECTPVCGVPYDIKAQILLSNGKKTKYAKYPWHAGLYWRIELEDGAIQYKYQCGGTLIDTNKVLTAGHCVWEAGKNVKDPKEIVVTFGKYYSSWNIREDLEQRHHVSVIIPGKHYNGATTKYSQDIAVLILTKDVLMSDYIMPACLDLSGNYGGIPKNQLGLVVGWGRTSESDPQPSSELMEAYMEYLDLDSCRKKYSKFDFTEYLQSDKFCVVYKDGTGTQMGDSGGGMTFTHDSLHYVYGVVSIKKGGQDEFAAFTNVLSHSSWILDIMQQHN